MPQKYRSRNGAVKALVAAGFSVDPYYFMAWPQDIPEGYPTIIPGWVSDPTSFYQGPCGIPCALGTVTENGGFIFWDGESRTFQKYRSKVAKILGIGPEKIRERSRY